VIVDRLARHAKLYGCEGIFTAAIDELDGRELARLAAILRRLGWRPTKADQARIDEARTAQNGNTAGHVLPPMSQWSATSGWSPLSPHGERVLSVTDDDSDRRVGPVKYGAQRDATCPTCGRGFKAVRSTKRYCGDTCRQRAHRGSA
jgi:hypothetical protein